MKKSLFVAIVIVASSMYHQVANASLLGMPLNLKASLQYMEAGDAGSAAILKFDGAPRDSQSDLSVVV